MKTEVFEKLLRRLRSSPKPDASESESLPDKSKTLDTSQTGKSTPSIRTEVKEIKIRGLSEAERNHYRRLSETLHRLGELREGEYISREAHDRELERHIVDHLVQAREPRPENRPIYYSPDYSEWLQDRLVPRTLGGTPTATMGGFGSYSTTRVEFGRGTDEPAPAHIIIGGTEKDADEEFSLIQLRHLYDFLFLIRAVMGQGTKEVRRYELINQINRSPIMRGHGVLSLDASLSEVVKMRDLAEQKIHEYLRKYQNIRL